LRKHFHDLEKLRRDGIAFGKSLGDRKGPEIALLRAGSLDVDLRVYMRATFGSGVADRSSHHIREFSYAVTVVAELRDERGIGERARLHTNRFVPRAIEAFQPGELIVVHSTVQPEGNRLRDGRIRSAVDSEAARDRLDGGAAGARPV